VTIGVVWLLTVFIGAASRQAAAGEGAQLEIAALYWHFVDVVWIVISPSST